MKKTPFFAVLAISCVLVVSAGAQQKDHLVALYLFDDKTGDVVKDLSGNGNDGALQGDVKWVDGKFGGGLEFNGADAFVEIPNSDSLALTDGLTITMWVNLNAYSTAGGTGVTKESSYKAGTQNQKTMMFRATTAGGDWGNNVVAGKSAIPLAEWHHVAATYDAASGDAIVYLDGKEDGREKFSGEIVPNTDVVWIGRGMAPFFDGIYDEVAIWNTPLSPDEIITAMNTLSAVEPAGKLASTWGRTKAVLTRGW